MKENLRKIDIIAVAVIFISVLLISACFSLLEINNHQIFMLKPAIDVASGRMIFRDTFTMYGALTTYIQALAIKIFGERLMVIQLLTAFIYSVNAVLLWYIWSYLLDRWWTVASCIIWILLARFYLAPLLPWSSVYALFSCSLPPVS